MFFKIKIKLRAITRLVVTLGAVLFVAMIGISETDAASTDGRELYSKFCAACHGKNLEGQPNWRTRNSDGTLPAPPHDQTGHTWHHPNKHLFDYIKFGGAALYTKAKSAMPGFKNLISDEKIWAVLNYIKSRWPEKIRKRHKMLNQRSQ